MENEDDELRDLPTDTLISQYTEQQIHRQGPLLSPANVLRPIARALGRLGASMKVPIHVLLIEVTMAYDALVASPEPAPPKKRRTPAKAEVSCVDYRMTLPRRQVDKLVDAQLVHECGCGRFHPNLPMMASPTDRAAVKKQIDLVVDSLNN